MGFCAALAAAYVGMRDLMVESGGFCASGGPFEIASECSERQVVLIVVGTFGLFVSWAIYAGFSAWGGWSILGGSLAMWGATFAVLGWNFVEFGLDSPDGGGAVWGWLVSGIVFWLMAAAGLVPAVLMLVSRLRRRDEPERPLFPEPLVRARVRPRGEGEP